MIRAESWNQSIESGFEPKLYEAEILPEGEWTGVLDRKIWGRKVCLACYFTSAEGRKFVLRAFRIHDSKKIAGAGEWYTPRDGRLDFTNPAVEAGQKFILTTSRNSLGRPLWQSARRIAAPNSTQENLP